MSWSLEAVRQAWIARERARQRMSRIAAAVATDPETKPDSEAASSLDVAIDKLNSVVRPRFIVEVFNDFIVVEDASDVVSTYGVAGPRIDGALFKVPYSVNDAQGTIDFGEPVAVQMAYKPMSELSDLHRVLLSNPMSGVDVVYTDSETGDESVLALTMGGRKLVSLAERS